MITFTIWKCYKILLRLFGWHGTACAMNGMCAENASISAACGYSLSLLSP